MIFTTGVGSWFFIFPLVALSRGKLREIVQTSFHLRGRLREIVQTPFHLGGGFGKMLKPHFTSGEASGNCSSLISLRGRLRENIFSSFHRGGSLGQMIFCRFITGETSGFLFSKSYFRFSRKSTKNRIIFYTLKKLPFRMILERKFLIYNYTIVLLVTLLHCYIVTLIHWYIATLVH